MLGCGKVPALRVNVPDIGMGRQLIYDFARLNGTSLRFEGQVQATCRIAKVKVGPAEIPDCFEFDAAGSERGRDGVRWLKPVHGLVEVLFPKRHGPEVQKRGGLEKLITVLARKRKATLKPLSRLFQLPALNGEHAACTDYVAAICVRSSGAQLFGLQEITISFGKTVQVS